MLKETPAIDRPALEAVLTNSLTTLYQEEQQIITLDVAERTICGRLAAILDRHFDKHSVHVEYNRHGIDPKEIEMPGRNGALTLQRVFPDVIVHQPGHDDENILVIEVKKSTNPATDDGDLRKLEQLQRQLNYRFAVFLRLSTGQGSQLENVDVQWI